MSSIGIVDDVPFSQSGVLRRFRHDWVKLPFALAGGLTRPTQTFLDPIRETASSALRWVG